MIIYSVTVTLDETISGLWLAYMSGTHIPEVMATGYFLDYTFQKLLDPEPDEGTVTYNIQYLCDSAERLEKYQLEKAPALQADHMARFKDRFVAFRSVLERI